MFKPSLLDEIVAMSPTGDDNSLKHLQHVFEGYRAAVTAGGCDNMSCWPDGVPMSQYHRGGAKDMSWRLGVTLASNDMKGIVDPIVQEKVHGSNR